MQAPPQLVSFLIAKSSYCNSEHQSSLQVLGSDTTTNGPASVHKLHRLNLAYCGFKGVSQWVVEYREKRLKQLRRRRKSEKRFAFRGLGFQCNEAVEFAADEIYGLEGFFFELEELEVLTFNFLDLFEIRVKVIMEGVKNCGLEGECRGTNGQYSNAQDLLHEGHGSASTDSINISPAKSNQFLYGNHQPLLDSPRATAKQASSDRQFLVVSLPLDCTGRQFMRQQETVRSLEAKSFSSFHKGNQHRSNSKLSEVCLFVSQEKIVFPNISLLAILKTICRPNFINNFQS